MAEESGAALGNLGNDGLASRMSTAVVKINSASVSLRDNLKVSLGMLQQMNREADRLARTMQSLRAGVTGVQGSGAVPWKGPGSSLMPWMGAAIPMPAGPTGNSIAPFRFSAMPMGGAHGWSPWMTGQPQHALGMGGFSNNLPASRYTMAGSNYGLPIGQGAHFGRSPYYMPPGVGAGGVGGGGSAAGAAAIGLGTFGIGAIGISAAITDDRWKQFDDVGYRFQGRYGGSGSVQSQMRGMASAVGPSVGVGVAAQMLDSAMYNNLAANQTGFKNVLSSAGTLSRLDPSMQGAAGVQAQAGLFQAQNINFARMFGIQMRDSRGNNRPIEDVSADVWKALNPSGKIMTKDELAYEFMSGRAADSLVRSITGGDQGSYDAVRLNLQGIVANSGKAAPAPGTKARDQWEKAAGSGSYRAAEAAAAQVADSAGIEGMEAARGASDLMNQSFADLGKSMGLAADAVPRLQALFETIGALGEAPKSFAGLPGVSGGLGSNIGGSALGSAGGLALLWGARKAAPYIAGKFRRGASSAGPRTVPGTVVSGGRPGAPSTMGAAGAAARASAGRASVLGVALAGAASLRNPGESWAAGADGQSDVFSTNPITDVSAGTHRWADWYSQANNWWTGGSNPLNDMLGMGGGEESDTGKQSSTLSKGGVVRLLKPCNGPITSKFGMRMHPIYKKMKLHGGIDIGAPNGAAVVAAESGRVEHAGGSSGGWGTYIKIIHNNGLSTLYAHLSRAMVKPGTNVQRGQRIGSVGSTGTSTGNHLHFEVYRNGVRVDPAPYIGGGAVAGSAQGSDKESSSSTDASGLFGASRHARDALSSAQGAIWAAGRIVGSLGGGGGSKPDGGATGKGALVGNSNAERVFNYLTSSGFTPQSAAGVIGNLMQESRVNPLAKQSPGLGRGIMQWTENARWASLKKWAGDRDPWSLDTQVGFMMKEMRDYGVLSKLQKMTSVQAATLFFERKMERAGKPMMENRYKYAEQALNSYGGGKSYSEGSKYIEKDQVANLHQGEMVVPQGVAQELRDFMAQGRKNTPSSGGNAVNIYVQVQRASEAEARALAERVRTILANDGRMQNVRRG